jgi:hypothetical protein
MLGAVGHSASLEGSVTLVGWDCRFCGHRAIIFATGAHAEIPRSFAMVANSKAFTPPLECALSINSDKRSLGVLGRSLAAISTLGLSAVRVGEEGRPEGSTPAWIGLARPVLVVARRAFAAFD